MNTEIIVKQKNRIIIIRAEVKDSLHASLLADRLNGTTYLKVTDRKYCGKIAEITAHTIPVLFTIQKLHDDLDGMSDLIINTHESFQSTEAV